MLKDYSINVYINISCVYIVKYSTLQDKLTSAKLLSKIIVITAVSKYLFSIS